MIRLARAAALATIAAFALVVSFLLGADDEARRHRSCDCWED